MPEIRTETRELAKEPDGPLNPSQAVPTAIMFFIAMLGGFVAFYRKQKEGAARAINFTELIGELVVSGVCGVFALWLFKGFGLNEYFIAAGVGIVGHMGSRALFMAEQAAKRWVDRWSGEDSRDGVDRRDQ